MKLVFFDGPLEGSELVIGSIKPISKILLENDNGDILRYECDQIQEVLDTRSGHETVCRMVLSRLPIDFDDELCARLREEMQ